MPDIERHVYHLVGSPTSDFFFELSMIYAREIFLPPGWSQRFLMVYPDGNWSVGGTLETQEDSMSPNDLMASLSQDYLMIPHMFCSAGMTLYRNFFEKILGFRLVGSTGDVLATAADKIKTKILAESIGISVPKGGLVGERTEISPELPTIVKPNGGDNSEGLTLVFHQQDIGKAIGNAAKFDKSILVEEFIPGRELRVAVLELDNELYVPPIIEYAVDEDRPIRDVQDKLALDSDGIPRSQAQKTKIGFICPAFLDDNLAAKVKDAAKKMHRVLGARDYSLFDFRVDARTGEVVFLEAGLYWSFSKASMISKMLIAGGDPVTEFVDKIWTKASTERLHL